MSIRRGVTMVLSLVLTTLFTSVLVVPAQQAPPPEAASPPPAGPPQQAPRPEASPSPAGPAQNLVAPAGWFRFSPAAELFSVLLPKQPTEEVTKSTISAGVEVTNHAYTASDSDSVFVVCYLSDLPLAAEKMSPQYQEGFYKEMWKGMAEGIRLGLEKNGLTFTVQLAGGSRKSIVGGHDGRAQDFTIGPLQGRAQLLVLDHHAYLIANIVLNDKAISHRDTFFGSFQIREGR